LVGVADPKSLKATRLYSLSSRRLSSTPRRTVRPSPFSVHQVGSLPGPRADSAGAVLGDVAYLIGGEDGRALDTIVALAFR
jgi:hypothetical protein